MAFWWQCRHTCIFWLSVPCMPLSLWLKSSFWCSIWLAFSAHWPLSSTTMPVELLGAHASACVIWHLLLRCGQLGSGWRTSIGWWTGCTCDIILPAVNHPVLGFVSGVDPIVYPDFYHIDTEPEAVERVFHVAGRWQLIFSCTALIYQELFLLLFAHDHNVRHSCEKIWSTYCHAHRIPATERQQPAAAAPQAQSDCSVPQPIKKRKKQPTVQWGATGWKWKLFRACERATCARAATHFSFSRGGLPQRTKLLSTQTVRQCISS